MLANKLKLPTARIHRQIKKLHGWWLHRAKKSIFNRQDQWDVLILLDGCRYDTFKKVNFLPGKLEKLISVESCTEDWAQASLTQTYPAIVYVSANPFLSHYYLTKHGQAKCFFHLEEVWDDGWDKQLRTVPPQIVTQAGLKMLKKYPQKKLFLHYMQPHHPFIGKTRFQEYGWLNAHQPKPAKQKIIYELLKEGKVDRQQVIQAYEENLILVLQAIQPILDQAKNKQVVITSDHGNGFGEAGIYAHPAKLYVPELLEVPWFKVAV
ncbi:MAG: hypothetical protein GF390_02535 [Candidatus Pacebacteria bacterium]|nr:hypothetical protein [Candidatus Paceibacterota bacterium]